MNELIERLERSRDGFAAAFYDERAKREELSRELRRLTAAILNEIEDDGCGRRWLRDIDQPALIVQRLDAALGRTASRQEGQDGI